MKTKSQNDLRVDELMELFNYLRQLGNIADRQLLQVGYELTSFPEINPQHFANFSQIIQTKIQPIWELFESFYKMKMSYLLAFNQPGERNARFQDTKSKLVAAFKRLQRCPLILAMEIGQEELAKFLLDCDMLKICNCAKLLSMEQHSKAMFHYEIIFYFQNVRQSLPREFDLHAAYNGRLQALIQGAEMKHVENMAMENMLTRFQNYALPFNQQVPMPFPNFANDARAALINGPVQNQLAQMLFQGLPNNFNGAINNQIQVPAAMPNNPAGAFNNQAQQAAGPNPGMPNNPAGGINNTP